MNNEFHFICLGQPLKQIDLRRKFHAVLFDKTQFQTDAVLLQRKDPTAIFFPVDSVADRHFLAGAHTQYIFDMIDIGSPDNDTFSCHIDLIRLYKKLIHC